MMMSWITVRTDDGHEGVEVPDVEALLGHVDEELDRTCSVLLLHRLEGHRGQRSTEINTTEKG